MNEFKEHTDGLTFYERRGRHNNRFWRWVAVLLLIAAALQWPDAVVSIAHFVGLYFLVVTAIIGVITVVIFGYYRFRYKTDPDGV